MKQIKLLVALLVALFMALAAFLGCSGRQAAQSRDDRNSRAPRVHYAPMEQVCPEKACEYQEELAPASEFPSADIKAGLGWILRNGHRFAVEMPKLTDSVYVVGEFVPEGHVKHAQSLEELSRLAQQKGELQYIRVWDEEEDLIISGRIRGRILEVDFGFDSYHGRGLIGGCTFMLYQREGRLMITDIACVIS